MYSVIQVISTFENGVFKQELQANINRSYQAEAVQTTLNPILDNSGAQLYNGATLIKSSSNNQFNF